MRSVAFDSFSLSSGNYVVRNVLHDSATPRDLFLYDLTREGGSELVNAEWKPKKIIVEGTIKGTSISDLETNIDLFKKNLSGQKKNLDVQYIDGTRRYEATAKSISIERDFYHVTYVPYSIEFTIPSGFGKATTSTPYSTQSIIAHTLEADLSILGTVAPKYSITLDFETATSITTVSVTINGDKITIDEAISADQILVIDAENKKVTLDGIEKVYAGLFPRLILGTNSYKIETSSTNHLFDVSVNYTKKYL